jgi:predicted small metal-binding protein
MVQAATITVRCACGWEATGHEDDVVAATVEHGARLHNMTPTRDEVLAMAITPQAGDPLGNGTTPDPRGIGRRST